MESQQFIKQLMLLSNWEIGSRCSPENCWQIDMVAVSKHCTDSGLITGSDRAYVVGRIQPALEEITISEFFARTVSCYPDREACVFCQSGERWTWSQLSQKVDQLAAVFDSYLQDRLLDIERVDMRYDSGFAVQWRGGGSGVVQLAGYEKLSN